MATPLIELYPETGAERDLRGLHLHSNVRSRPSADGSYVYTGYIASLDGKIALEGSSGAPAATRNERDWGLFQELMMQADVVLASGRYVRDRAEGGSTQPMVPSADDPNVAHLVQYRQDEGLPVQPSVAVVTGQANFDPQVASTLADNVIAVLGRRRTHRDHRRPWRSGGQ